jgi:DNA polymerase III delta prime subunit
MKRPPGPAGPEQNASPSAGLRDEIRRLVQRDRISEALDRLADEARTQNSAIEIDATVLGRRLRSVDNAEGTGTLTRENAEAERTSIATQLLLLNDRLNGRPQARPSRLLSAAEARARERYLGIVRRDVENRRSVSIHNARFIDLGIADSVSATYLPWIYRDPDSASDFRSFEDAFEVYERRLLLLGAPGSGKTTTLLHVARCILEEAEANVNAPVPLVVNLSKLRLDRGGNLLARLDLKQRTDEGRRDDRVERWLISELSEYPGVSGDIARRWVEEGRIAALLDGLDEVDDAYRGEVVRVLNVSFLRDYPDSTVLVCSRIGEYQPLRSSKETRLAVNGGITLQPLSDEKIIEYLRAADATGLLEALRRDKALHEIARTPLTLSMMTLAYGGTAPSNIPTNVSLTEQRHHLMETYVGRMLQRKERRDRGVPFDLSAENDIPPHEYAYSPDEVFRYLGWLAVRLSVRMQTAFSLEFFFIFLRRTLERDQASVVWWTTALACAPLVFACTLVAGASVAPATISGLQGLALLALSGSAACVPAAWFARPKESVPVPVRSLHEALGFGGCWHSPSSAWRWRRARSSASCHGRFLHLRSRLAYSVSCWHCWSSWEISRTQRRQARGGS